MPGRDSILRFSVITVVRNAQDTIRDTLESVVAQRGVEVEHIVVDGLSTDATLSIVREFRLPSMRLISEPDHGIYDAMTKGLRIATGDFVGFLNSDDYFCRNDALSQIADSARAFPTYEGIAGGVVIVDPINTERVIREYRSVGYKPWMARFGHMLPHPGVYLRRSAAEQVGEFDTALQISGDFDWLTRFMWQYNFRIKTIRPTLVAMRNSGVSTRDFESRFRGNHEILQSLAKNGIASFPLLIAMKFAMKSMQMLSRPSDYPAAADVRWPSPNSGGN